METLTFEKPPKNKGKKSSYADRALRLFAQAEDESFVVRESLYAFEPSFSEWIAAGWHLLTEELGRIAAGEKANEECGWIHLAQHVRAFRSQSMSLAYPLLCRYYSAEEVSYITGWTNTSSN